MKIYVNDKLVYEIDADKEAVLKSYLLEEEYEAEIERRVIDSVNSKYLACLDRIKNDWESTLISNGVTMTPTDKAEYAKLVFKQHNYKNRTAREAEMKASKESK